MSYRKANEVLPRELIEAIQRYIDGENIYIPRKSNERREWGQNTSFRQELMIRNENIVSEYINGATYRALSIKYYLSEKSIQRIVRNQIRVM